MNRNWTNRLVALALVLAAGGAAWALTPSVTGNREHDILIMARQYAYDPPVIRVNKGDVLRLRFKTCDVVHGFYLEGYDLDVKIMPEREHVELTRPSQRDAPAEQVKEVTVVADKQGKFRYRCSHTCGTLHPFMMGELIVGPNLPYRVAIGLTFGTALAGMFLCWRKDSSDQSA